MRDMSEQQFREALARHNMKYVGFMGYVEMGIEGQRTSVCRFNAGTNRRAQLAYLLERQEYFATHDIHGNPKPEEVSA